MKRTQRSREFWEKAVDYRESSGKTRAECAKELCVELFDPDLEGIAERIGFEESYRLGYRRGGPVKLVVARAKYKVEKEGSVDLVTVDRPRELMRRGLLAPSLIARVLVAKYCFGLPFHQRRERWSEPDEATKTERSLLPPRFAAPRSLCRTKTA